MSRQFALIAAIMRSSMELAKRYAAAVAEDLE